MRDSDEQKDTIQKNSQTYDWRDLSDSGKQNPNKTLMDRIRIRWEYHGLWEQTHSHLSPKKKPQTEDTACSAASAAHAKQTDEHDEK